MILVVIGLLPAAPAAAQTLGKEFEQAWARHPQALAAGAREAAAVAGAEIASGLTPAPASMSVSSLNDRLDRNRGKQEWEVEMAVPLWLPGQQAAHVDAAESTVAEAAARRAALRLQLAGELRDTWWGLALARQALDLAERREATASALEVDVLRRFKAGDLARVDANLAQAERLAAQAELLDARAQLQKAEQAYYGLAGGAAPAALNEEVVASSPGNGAIHPQMELAAAAARSARARLKVADETRRAAPELAVRLVRDRGEFGASYANTLGVKLTLPFSSGPRVRQDSSAARADSVQADAELVLLEQKIGFDSSRARVELDTAERLLAMARQRHELSTDNLRLAEKSFALGESDLAALLRARASAHEAEALLGRQRVARAASISRLNQTLGVMP